MKQIAFLSIAAAIILTSCQSKPATVDLKAEADAIRNLEDQWTNASREKNLDKIVGLFAPDGAVMEVNRPIVTGTEAIRNIQQSLLSDTTILWETFQAKTDYVEIASSGDLAFARGSYMLNMKLPDGTVETAGKWVDVWKKINGEWKVFVNISNYDNP